MASLSFSLLGGLLPVTLLGLPLGGCAAPARSVSAPRSDAPEANAAEAEAGSQLVLVAADVSRLAPEALARSDTALLRALLRVELADLETAHTPPGHGRLVRLAQLAHRLADTLKFEATCAPPGASREQLVDARLELAERALSWLEPGLARFPDDAALTFAVGELLAFRIDSVVSGMSLGPRSQRVLERAVRLGAGADAELALARRFYYLPSFAGGDLAAAESAVRATLGRHPTHVASLAFLGEVLHARGDLAGARQALERTRALDPHNPRARVLLADPHLELRP